MLGSVVVGGDDRPPSTESQDHERKFPEGAVPQRVGRIGARPEAVDGALIGEQRPDRPLERPPGDHDGRDPRHRCSAAVGGAELHLPGIGLDRAAECSDLDGPSIDHVARAERVQILGLAIEGIVGRSRHAHEQPRGQPLIEVQAAEHGLRDHPLAPAGHIGPG